MRLIVELCSTSWSVTGSRESAKAAKVVCVQPGSDLGHKQSNKHHRPQPLHTTHAMLFEFFALDCQTCCQLHFSLGPLVWCFDGSLPFQRSPTAITWNTMWSSSKAKSQEGQLRSWSRQEMQSKIARSKWLSKVHFRCSVFMKCWFSAPVLRLLVLSYSAVPMRFGDCAVSLGQMLCRRATTKYSGGVRRDSCCIVG